MITDGNYDSTPHLGGGNSTTTHHRAKAQGLALASVLSALVLTLLLEARDQTIVGTALPHIVASLQGYDRYTRAVTAYMLGWCSLIPIVVLIPQFALTRIGAIARMQAIMRIAASRG